MVARMALFAAAVAAFAQPREVTVSDAASLQAAIDGAGSKGAVIRLRPGTYKQVFVIAKPHIQLRGTGAKPEDVMLTFDNSAGTAGGTTRSASVTVSGDDFYAENLTFENSFSRNRPLTQQGSQAVALKVTGDRAVFRRVRFLGYQDTLYANNGRQYFADCYIEGNVDFIFGNAPAFFDRCEIHALAHPVVYLTAQSRLTAGDKSGYVFHRCRITAEKGAERVYLGRPWRAYSTVIWLNSEMPAAIVPEGWHEWEHDGKPSLPTSFYAEYRSTGPGARPDSRRQLTDAEAAQFALPAFLAGDDQWDPRNIH
ncbi:MAG: pectin esterase [Acidobacteria bacterium]|nr:pectin esterase [Acidobacteriota bacterium]